MASARTLLPAVSLGFISLLLQVTVLRELLTVFSGNELDIGITLAVWLVGVGVGSFGGSRISARRGFGFSFLLVAVLAGPTLAGIWLIRPALGVELGETISLGATMLSTTAVLFPLCLVLGGQFPLAAADLRARGGPWGEGDLAPRVYGLEAMGAVAGGMVFSFVLAGRVPPAGLVLVLAALSAGMASYLLGRRWPLVVLVLPLAAFLVSLRVAGRETAGGEVVTRTQSRYGEILVTRRGEQTNVYGSGHYLFSYPDRQTEERNVHLPMTLHPEPRFVLAVGGSPAMLREFAKYGPERVDFVEMDPELVETSLGLLDEEDASVLEREGIRVVVEDARRYVKGLDAPVYDMVVLSLAPPSSANLNRFYTVEFFGEVRHVLRPGGVLVLSLPTSGAYVGRRTREANGSVYRSLGRSFRHVAVSTEEYGLFAASDSPLETNPERLRMRFSGSGVRTDVFHPSVLQDSFAPLRVLLHRNRLDEAGAVNTDLRPVAYLLNLMLWAEVQGSWLLGAALEHGVAAAVLLLAAFAAACVRAFRNRRRTLWMSSVSTGYAAMAMVMAVMLGFQAAYGYVYAMLGLLSALFMGGVALGSRVAPGGRMRGLALIEACAALLAAVPMVIFSGRAFFALFSLGAGVVTGCAFRAVNLRVRGEDPVRAGGMLYGFDLLGSFLGALLSAVLFVPVLGIRESLLVACVMKAGSAALAVVVRDE